jgi:hypothetical protein
VCFDFLYNFGCNVSHSKKNWARCGHKCTTVFTYSACRLCSRTVPVMFTYSAGYVHVQCRLCSRTVPVMFTYSACRLCSRTVPAGYSCNGTWILSTDFRKILKSNFTKTRSVEAELFHTDGRTDRKTRRS